MATPLLRYGSLALLVAQDTALVLLLRFSRARAQSGPLYVASTAVLCMETAKLATCFVMLAWEAGSASQLRQLVHRDVAKPKEIAKLALPALLYLVQNNLLYFALSHLRATPYKVTYNLKILTGAMFSVALLGQRLGPRKWASLVVLFAGVAVVQTGKHEQASGALTEETLEGQTLGFLAVAAAAVTSGFAGVYQQKILQGSPVSMWVRNIQMGMTSVMVGVVSVVAKDGAIIQKGGFFQGYSPLVWGVIALQAVGGLNVAFILKYADNILKGFAAAFSTLASCVLEILLFGFQPTWAFLAGATLINAAAYAYSSAAAPARKVAPGSDAPADKLSPMKDIVEGTTSRKRHETFRV
ncbi:nucleotide-sugar transporter-domain-containing protein [Pelagophyceae sp. CCMP2097]|nr:nucleotide-sugar transporter-domain-containing protein [Pelagophyceae sp. CCMP2097]